MKAFEEEVGHEITVPKHFGVMGAIGSAILAKEQIERTGKKTKFTGFSLSEVDFKPTSIICSGCSNSCEVIRIYTDGKITATWGDKFGKWTNALETN
ncbi:hypothetical protein SDC9_191139 [bioreactor metagenome]|uniref:Uncharacterized protein n=1 Tax=bioreactor metagenome TaxID=1076179 RepID=A0A645HZF7_9ZZZZ